MAQSVRLTADEAWEVLAGAHTGVLSSLRRDGAPISLPVWFVAIDRKIYVSGPARSRKFARMRHDPRVSFLVFSGERWVDLVGVQVNGRAHEVTDGPLTERVGAALDEKYSSFRTSRADMPAATRTYYETAVATIEIVPDDRILSWSNARMFGSER
jgi:nitroimidazol reductase NimA-like FMN-containing flavoprotein (pyridoxamine 5'-phosphate oxidase superfamily)